MKLETNTIYATKIDSMGEVCVFIKDGEEYKKIGYKGNASQLHDMAQTLSDELAKPLKIKTFPWTFFNKWFNGKESSVILPHY